MRRYIKEGIVCLFVLYFSSHIFYNYTYALDRKIHILFYTKIYAYSLFSHTDYQLCNRLFSSFYSCRYAPKRKQTPHRFFIFVFSILIFLFCFLIFVIKWPIFTKSSSLLTSSVMYWAKTCIRIPSYIDFLPSTAINFSCFEQPTSQTIVRIFS